MNAPRGEIAPRGMGRVRVRSILASTGASIRSFQPWIALDQKKLAARRRRDV